jgi:signal transduction histidine kinase
MTVLTVEIQPREDAPDPAQFQDRLGLRAVSIDRQRVAERARAAERARVARELHDTVAQELLGVLLHLNVALRAIPTCPTTAYAAVQVAIDRAEAGLADTRRVVGELRAAPGETPDLVAELRCLVRATADGIDPVVRFVHTLPACRVSAARAEHLIRIAGEAVANARLHSAASEVVVSLGQADGDVRLAVVDDGVGFAPARRAAGRYGLVGMAERAAEAGCALVVRSRPGRGTTVEIRWPAE